MERIDRALQNTNLQLDEITATERWWKNCSEFIAQRASSLFPYLDSFSKKQLNEALRDRATDSSTLYRSLIIQLYATFEGFIKSLISGIIDEKCKKITTYDQLDEKIRTEHLVSSARILTYAKTGTVNGIPHDFKRTENNLISCLTGKKDYEINKEAFTLLLGNCTPDRLEALFESLGLKPPFDDTLGENKKLQEWAGDSTKRRVVKKVKEELYKQLDNRNEIIHGNTSKTVTQNDFQMAEKFFRGLTEGLSNIAKNSI